MNKHTIFGIVVEYYADPTKMVDDHNSEPMYLTEIRERRFDDIFEAIKFLTECNSAITDVSELIPSVKIPKNFKLVLPEQNIKIKHQATNATDSLLDDAIDWG